MNTIPIALFGCIILLLHDVDVDASLSVDSIHPHLTGNILTFDAYQKKQAVSAIPVTPAITGSKPHGSNNPFAQGDTSTGPKLPGSNNPFNQGETSSSPSLLSLSPTPTGYSSFQAPINQGFFLGQPSVVGNGVGLSPSNPQHSLHDILSSFDKSYEGFVGSVAQHPTGSGISGAGNNPSLQHQHTGFGLQSTYTGTNHFHSNQQNEPALQLASQPTGTNPFRPGYSFLPQTNHLTTYDLSKPPEVASIITEQLPGILLADIVAAIVNKPGTNAPKLMADLCSQLKKQFFLFHGQSGVISITELHFHPNSVKIPFKVKLGILPDHGNRLIESLTYQLSPGAYYDDIKHEINYETLRVISLEIRKQIVAELRRDNNYGVYRELLEADANLAPHSPLNSLKTYVDSLESPGTSGGDAVIRAFSNYYKANVLVLDERTWQLHLSDNSNVFYERTIFLLYRRLAGNGSFCYYSIMSVP